MAELKWNEAIGRIQEIRDPIMFDIYEQTAKIQEAAAGIFRRHRKHYKKHGEVPKPVAKLITDFAYKKASQWHEDWKFLGDQLLTDYWAIQATSANRLPEWWLDLIEYEAPVP